MTSWPALWLLGIGGWPPEIDVYEGFGHSSTFYLNSMTSCAIHGGARNVQSFSGGGNIKALEGGFTPSLADDFHLYQVDIQFDYITVFMDGLEIFQFVNFNHKEPWYPIMNVGVKTNATTAAYDTGNGNMQVKSFKVWAQ